MFRRIRTIIAAAALASAAVAGAQAEPPYPIEWTRQLGTSMGDRSHGVAADPLGNVFISGFTGGSLGGPSHTGDWWDAFVWKYDASGSVVWTRQLGTSDDDLSYAVAVDRLGNVLISGFTGGSLGGPNAGGYDVFVGKYNPSGTLLWTRQLGTAAHDYGSGTATDAFGNVFVCGHTAGNLGGPNAGLFDAFVSKYDSSGNLLWTRQRGASNYDRSYGVAPDGLGNVFVTGSTQGRFGWPGPTHTDAVVSKYDSSGDLLWTRQLGTSGDDVSSAVAADALGNVFISGSTEGSLGGPNAGLADAFVSKYGSSGDLIWTRQLGTSNNDRSDGLALDALGNVFISGCTEGNLGGPNAGSYDAFVSKYDSSGSLRWTRQLGTSSWDESYAVAADPLGNIYISGYTSGGLGGPNAGGWDAFLVKLTVPEPSVILIVTAVGLPMLLKRRRNA